MLLPGGVWRDGERLRDLTFKPLTGEVELAMAEEAPEVPIPERVTAVLATALDRLGGEPVSPELVRKLCVGDRQFLARQLAARLGRDDVWLTAECGHCDESFDFQLRQSTLPVKEAGPDEPRARVETSRGTWVLRPPTGADQEAVARIDDDEEAIGVLVRRCLVTVDGKPAEESVEPGTRIELDDTDLTAIEEALEAVSPEVALRIRAHCPECDRENEVWVNPYLSLRGGAGDLFAEIHTLADAYGWTEDEILRLPRPRRRTYLRLVDRSRGMHR